MLVGADAEQLEGLAAEYGRGVRTSEEIATGLVTLADQRLPVFGPLGQQLAQELRTLGQELSAGAGDLSALVTSAQQNAAQQRGASRALDSLGGAAAQAGMPAWLVRLGSRIDRMRAQGVPPSRYAHLLQRYWVAVGAQRAGIDMSRWNPRLGVDALRDVIPRVYSYYGNLYLQNPYMQWAGMANMMGPTFAAGFFDMALMRDVAQYVEGIPGLPVPVSPIAHLSDREIRFFETTFLQMQRDIFVDQSMMHEAYLAGGLPAIAELRQAGLIDPRTEQAWMQIDEGRRTGNTRLLEAGNTTLLYREQHDIIQHNYQRMYDRPVTGPAFTYMMTTIGEPSIPGARSFAEFRPLVVTVDTPGPRNIPFTDWDNPLQGQVTVQTPLPAGNVANFNDRWTHISQDTVPAYQQLLRENPELARQIIGTDISQRLENYRLYNRVDDLARQFTDWRVRFRQ